MSDVKKVAVVGGGFAGVAAAYRLHELGARPLVFSKGPGASGLTSGAFDVHPWLDENGGGAAEHPEIPWAQSFLSEAGIVSDLSWGARVATAFGLIRPAAWAGARVLNLEPFAGSRIGIFDVRRDDWLPSALCDQWRASDWAKSTGTQFAPIALPGVFSEAELNYPLSAFCRLLEESERMGALALALDKASDVENVAALICGPWLGSAATPLRMRVPVGEVLSPPEGAFGIRTRRALDAFLERLAITSRLATVDNVSVQSSGVSIDVTLVGESGSHVQRMDAFGVVVAGGGLVGGGVGLRADKGFPPVLGAMLDPGPLPLSGAQTGWDATAAGGIWVRPPHLERRVVSRSRVKWAGDGRMEQDRAAPLGTVVGAILSGKRAAEQLLS